jgi:hypothetical protein
MGRPALTLSDAQKAEVETLAAVLTAEQVADYFGIGRRTFYAMMQRDEEIAARYKRGKAKAIGVIAQGLINKARSGWRETVQVAATPPNEADYIDLTALSDVALNELMAAVKRADAIERGDAPPGAPRYISYEDSSLPVRDTQQGEEC